MTSRTTSPVEWRLWGAGEEDEGFLKSCVPPPLAQLTDREEVVQLGVLVNCFSCPAGNTGSAQPQPVQEGTCLPVPGLALQPLLPLQRVSHSGSVGTSLEAARLRQRFGHKGGEDQGTPAGEGRG